MIVASASTQAFPVLGMLVLLPLVGAAAVLLLPRSRVELVRPVAVLFMSGAAAAAGWMIAVYPVASGGFEMIVDQPWVAAWGISWKLGVDGISLFLLGLTALLFPLGALAVDPGHDHKAYYMWLLLLEFGCLGVFSALDL
ncbi:MAG: Fe-S-binding domain-containing protein, partial [bacterium]|nr:Fe-S-binding domain-containing protein [bacterium]